MKVDVLGLGTAAMDIVLRCENLPREDGFAFIHREELRPGGSCANVLVTLTSMGITTGMVAKIGDDYYGNVFKNELLESGVSAQYIQNKKNGTTLHTFITVTGNGSRAIFANMGDSLLSLSEEEVNPGMLEGVKIFYTDMFPGRPALKLARLCRERGIIVIFNLQCPPSFMELCHLKRGELEEMISLCHLFFSCQNGLLELATVDDYMEASFLVYQKYLPEMGLVSTFGDKGANWLSKEGAVFTPAFNVQAIDTTGAGDAFIGGLIYSYFFEQLNRKESMEFASACAAIKCTQLGARLRTTVNHVRNFIELHKNSQLSFN